MKEERVDLLGEDSVGDEGGVEALLSEREKERERERESRSGPRSRTFHSAKGPAAIGAIENGAGPPRDSITGAMPQGSTAEHLSNA